MPETTEAAVKERPIIFSAPMVRAIMDGRKTQTRRVVKTQPVDLPASPAVDDDGYIWHGGVGYPRKQGGRRCPYGRRGDHLWVREAWCQYGAKPIYRADYGQFTPISDGIGGPWKSPIHMPRAASRITLEITGVRIQRLQDISEEDATAEGAITLGPCSVPGFRGWWRDGAENIYQPGDAKAEFERLWDSINGDGAWDANPWVWAITFHRVP